LLDPPMLRALSAEGNALPLRAEDLLAVWPVRSQVEWVERYHPLVAPCLTPVDRRLLVLAAHVRNLVRQNVVYAELMVSGMLAPATPESAAVERFQAVRQAVDDAAKGRIQVELLACFGRGPVERAAAQAERIITLARERLIVGVALAGAETACTVESLAPIFARFRDAGLGIEIHAGEQAGPASVWDALEHGRPDRIGHGVRAFEDGRLIETLCKRGVHLEFCLTSNLCLGVVRSLQEHPLGRARSLGMSFSINTDDPGPFGCSMESEVELATRTFALTVEDRAAIRANACRASFARAAKVAPR
jgi:adenosine deaminase